MQESFTAIGHADQRQTPCRVKILGKNFLCNGEKFFIKGVTYGTFSPDQGGMQFPSLHRIEQDLALMAENGINAVRVYTVPPLHFLDAAHRKGIKVMVGLPWEQHITFLDDCSRKQDILNRVRSGVESCKGHPAVLCYAIGNEIPATIVRWYGARKIERFLKGLYEVVKHTDPLALVTYVNFPTTEFLDLPFLDFFCFNVYLEDQQKLERYLQRLHNMIGDRPLVLAEVGLDSHRNGTDKQAQVLEWQIQTLFAKGSAGVFVFAWTDEWWRGGYPIEDWDFGLVDRLRDPKPALATVRKAFDAVPLHSAVSLPFISVVVCTYNGSATIRDCMEGLARLDYPTFEVIVINDGSTDHSASIIQEYPVRLISTANQGLSSARNRGLQEARGEIIAYIDDDAYPDPHWLHYLAFAYAHTDHAGIGGPNIAPYDDGPIATAVANAPGGPIHVMLTDDIAEHIPGCNMSFRKDALLAVGGFDPVYRSAGDDVDLCWRIQHTGRTIGFHPSAVVWHHRRNSLKAYWKQQVGYGKAEALLENKWPEKYNEFGHVSWSGRIYGTGTTRPLKWQRDKIFHGIWGTAAYQSVYQSAPATLNALPLMPEWHILILVLGLLTWCGLLWPVMFWVLPLLLLAVSVVIIQAGVSAGHAVKLLKKDRRSSLMKYWLLISFLHLLQPVARLYGRLLFGLTPWRKRGSGSHSLRMLLLHRPELHYWSEQWKAVEQWLGQLEDILIRSRVRVRRGGNYDQWDLQTNCGLFSAARGLLTIEEHGGGKQMLKFKYWAKYSTGGIVVSLLFAGFSFLALVKAQFGVFILLGTIAAVLIGKLIMDTARSLFEIHNAFMILSGKVRFPDDQDEEDTDRQGKEEKPAYRVRTFRGDREKTEHPVKVKALYARKYISSMGMVSQGVH